MLCVARSPERPLASKSYCATVGFLACALLTPCKPSLTTEQEPGSAFCVARSPEKATSPKILLRHGRIFCLCPAHTLQAIPHHRTGAGKHLLCSQVSWKATSPKILIAPRWNFLPVPCSRPTSHPTSSERPLAPISYRATLGFFCLCSVPTLQSSSTTRTSRLWGYVLGPCGRVPLAQWLERWSYEP